MFTRVACFACCLFTSPLLSAPAPKWTPPITPTGIVRELAKQPAGSAAEELARKIRGAFGQKNLEARNVKPKLEETAVVWASLEPGRVTVTKADGASLGELTPVGTSGLKVLARELPNFTDLDYHLLADGKKIGGGNVRIEHYPTHPDSLPRAGVPEGRIELFEFRSGIYTNTVREVRVYVPAQYDGRTPAAVMVFQDGQRHGLRDSGLRTPVVFDNLIHKREMPVTVGIFIEPGRRPNQKPGDKSANRGYEYDFPDGTHARFLLEEILPEVTRRFALNLRADAMGRAIGGGSSGGICAFKTAWERPDQFGRVLSWVGSFVDLRGGFGYPELIRKTERKPIKVYLLDGDNDLDNPFGHWPIANRRMEAALKYMGYDHHLDWTGCFHGSKAMAAYLPDALRWLWRDPVPAGR